MPRLKISFSLVLWIISLLPLIISCESKDNPFVESKELGHTGQEGTIYDIDNNKYKIIGIGTQIWMAENLKVTRLNNGKPIQNIKDSVEWYRAEKPGYCWYNNDSVQNGQTYGALYNHFTIKTDSLCPVGWHVPSSEEWNVLIEYIGGREVAGGELKKNGVYYWEEPNLKATDKYGFSALPGGYRDALTDARFSSIKLRALFWCREDLSNFYAPFIGLNFSSSSAGLSFKSKQTGLSIRCILNDPLKR